MAGAQGIRAGRAYVEIGTHDLLTKGLNRAQRRLKAFGSAVTAIGTKLIKVAALMAAPFAMGAKVFGSFDKNMRMVSTMLGDAAGKWMPIFSQAAKDMAVEFGQSTATIAQGMYDLLSAQVAPAEMLGVLEAAMKGAIGGITDTEIAVKAIVRIMRGFGLEASDAADIVDVLAVIVEKGVINFEELSTTIGTVAPTAKAAGLSLGELAAAVATIVSVEEPARAMTALRQGLFEAAEEGMHFMDFVRQFEGKDLGQIIAAGIPKKAAAGIVILAQNLEVLDKNLEAVADRAGTAEEKYKQMAGGLSHTWGQMIQGAIAAFNEIGDAIEAPLLNAGESIKKMNADIANWIKKNRELVVTILKITVTLLAIGIAMVVVGKTIALFSALITVIKGVAVAVKILSLAFGILAANPVVAGLAAIVAIAGLVVVAFGSMTSSVAKLTDEAEKLLAVGDAQRRTDKLRMERLEQLAAVETKSAKQKTEAAGLIKTLTDRYGDLGISIDAVTGKISGMDKAQGEFNARMREAAAIELEAKIAELEDSYNKLRASMSGDTWWTTRTAAAKRAFDAENAVIAKQMESIKLLHKAAKIRLKALKGGDTGAAFGGETPEERLARKIREGKDKGAVPAGSAKAMEEAAEAIKKLATLDEAAARKHRTALENELHDIKAVVAERKRLIGVLIKGEEARKGGARPERIAELKLQLGETEHQGVVARVMAEERVAQKVQKIARDKASERLSTEKNLQYEIEQLEIMRTKKGHDQRMALIGLEERRALEAADADGLALGLTVRKFSLMRALAEAGKEVAKVDVQSRGQFSSRALWGIGGGKAADRTAKATEETAKNVKQLLRLEQAGGLVFTP